jgi:hypothetical protein
MKRKNELYMMLGWFIQLFIFKKLIIKELIFKPIFIFLVFGELIITLFILAYSFT